MYIHTLMYNNIMKIWVILTESITVLSDKRGVYILGVSNANFMYTSIH